MTAIQNNDTKTLTVMPNEVYTDLETHGEEKLEACLYDFVFHFNHHTGLWNAIPRDKYSTYWNNSEEASIIRSRSFTTLVDLIQRTKGDISKIDQLTQE